MFQLRRSNVGCDSRPPSSGAFEEETVLLLETTKIGRNPEAVDVVLTSTVHSNMISRIHSTIEAKQDKDRIVYILTDQSLNGTYINDYRAKGPTELKPGDIIKFGHVNGAAIRPGCHGPQHSAEFTFIFEKAPEGRMERRRPITIVGGARNNAEQSHTLIGQSLANDSRNQHTASRLPLTTSTSVEFPTWQTAAGTGAQQFYNLQRFPSYYPAAFSQINPAYLQQLWQQQNAWQQPVAAAQHLQQQQQQLQQQQHKQQQAALMSEPLMDSSWMSASVATDLQSSATSGGHFRAPTIQQTVVSHTQPLGASSAASVAAHNPQAVARFAATNFATGMMPGGANLLSSFAQRMCQQQQQQQQQPSNVATSGMSSSSAAAIAAAGGFPISASSQFAASTIASTVPPTVTAASTTVTTASSSPNMDNVKRMECDSSVPSPPKTQVTTAVTGAGPASTHITSGFHPRLFGAASSSSSSPAHQHAVKASTIRESCSAGLDTTVPMGGSPPRATTSLAQPVLPSSSSTALLLTQSKTTPAPTSNNQQQTSNAAINQVKANAKQEIDAPRTETESTPSHFSPASVSPESVPKMVATPASTTGTSRGRSPRSPLVKAESSVISSQSRSPSHHSPKRRGHGHSESSRSRSPTPAPSDVEKTSKKVRKSNEVARLLNDLTEGAWMGVARKSAKKNETNNSKTRAKTSDEDESSWSDSEKEPPKKAALKKKPGRKPRTSTTSSYQAATSESTEKRRRGRPPKRPKRVMPARKSTDSPTKKTGGTSKRSQPARAASRFESSSSSEDEESEPEEEEQKQTTPKKPSRELKKLGVVPNSSSGSAATPATSGNRTARRSAASASGGAASATPSSSTNSTPKKRGRPAKTPAIFREVSSDSSLMSSDSSISPRAKRKYTMPQRKVGMAPIMSNKKTPTRSAAKAKKSPAGKKVSATKKKPGRKSGGSAASSASKKTPAKVKRKKKNSESSSSSESEPEESLSESESRNTSAKAVLDEWSYHDPDKLCDAKTKCKKPQGENVDWVQCDLCDLWYHVECAVGYSEVLDEGEFDCGCKKKPSRKRARK